jgi:uroporphyrinogen-III synthase
MRVLVFRPLAAGERTAARLRARGHEAVLAPVTAIAPLDTPLPPGPFAAVLVTSASAFAASIPEALRDLPLLAVGLRTAEVARARGFRQVESANGNRHAFAELAAERLPPGARVLLIQGRDHKEDTAALLEAAGLAPVSWIAYAAETLPRLAEAAASALRDGRVDVALHYSRRSAVVALNLIEGAGLSRPFFACPQVCLSADVAQPLIQAGADRIVIAAEPQEEALFAAIDGGSAPSCPA